MPRAEDSKASHLLELIRLQVVTRQEAKHAAKQESPLVKKTAPDLINIILKSQGTNPLCIKLKKELGQDSHSRKGYTLDQRGLLLYKDKAVVPAQKSLI